MAILIKGMEMLRGCDDCNLKSNGYCDITNRLIPYDGSRHGDCPLVEVTDEQPDRNAQERYEDLCEYFKDCTDKGMGILGNRKEFKAWLERVHWHVVRCDELGRELEKLQSAQPEVQKGKMMNDAVSRQAAIEARRYTFGNDEFSLEDAYHDCKLVFDGITDDNSFQEADTGLVLYYANEIIYALQEALEGKDTNVPTNDCISRQAAIRWIKTECNPYGRPTLDYKTSCRILEHLDRLLSAQPEIIRCKDCMYFDKGWCNLDTSMGMSDFCSRAKRRTDD